MFPSSSGVQRLTISQDYALGGSFQLGVVDKKIRAVQNLK